MIDLDDDSKTENTRAAYKLEEIGNALPEKMAGHPRSVVFLTADAFGILPPIARLTRDQALFYFLSGFTSKLAGTEIGDQRAAADVLDLLRLAVPAAGADGLLADARREDRRARLGGVARQHRLDGRARSARASGCRSPRRGRCSTRRSPASSPGVEFRTEERFGFEVPVEVPGVDSSLLDPRSTWADPEAYDRKARELAEMFRKNFDEKFAADASPEVVAAGPRDLAGNCGRLPTHRSATFR